YDVPTISEQSLTEMRAEKAGSPGNQYACFKMHTPEFPLDCPITACHIGRQFPTSKIRMQSRSPANGPIRGKVSAKPNIEPRPFDQPVGLAAATLLAFQCLSALAAQIRWFALQLCGTLGKVSCRSSMARRMLRSNPIEHTCYRRRGLYW